MDENKLKEIQAELRTLAAQRGVRAVAVETNERGMELKGIGVYATIPLNPKTYKKIEEGIVNAGFDLSTFAETLTELRAWSEETKANSKEYEAGESVKMNPDDKNQNPD